MNWISVIDEHPKEGEIVLVYQDNTQYPQYNILVLMYYDSAFRDIIHEINIEEPFDDRVYLWVTHWMPLPEKP